MARAPQLQTEATPAERQAAENLGAVQSYLAALSIPLGTWAIPSPDLRVVSLGHGAKRAVEVGQISGPFYQALGAIYGTDTERARSAEADRNRFQLYRQDYLTVIPKFDTAVMEWTKFTLLQEELQLGSLRIRLQQDSGVRQRLHTTAKEIGKASGGFAPVDSDYRGAVRVIRTADTATLQVSDVQMQKAIRQRVAPEVRKAKDELVSTLFAHPEGVAILTAYSESADAGTKRALREIERAEEALRRFWTELTDPAQTDHVWRYRPLVAGGVAWLRLHDVAGFPEFAMGLAQLRSRSMADVLVGFAGIALFCLGPFFGGPVGMLVLAIGDLAFSGAGAGLAYVREREQELGVKAGLFSKTAEPFGFSSGYLDTILNGAAALLSAIALFSTAKATRALMNEGKLGTGTRPAAGPATTAKSGPAAPAADTARMVNPKTELEAGRATQAGAPALEERGIAAQTEAAPAKAAPAQSPEAPPRSSNAQRSSTDRVEQAGAIADDERAIARAADDGEPEVLWTATRRKTWQPPELSTVQQAKLDRIKDGLEANDLDWTSLGFDSEGSMRAFFDRYDDMNAALTELERRYARTVRLTGELREEAALAKAASDPGLPPLTKTDVIRAIPGFAAGGEGLPASTGRLFNPARGQVAAIPGQIAERMRSAGPFRSWRHFRETFWRFMAEDAEIASKFSPANRARMAEGWAPFVEGGQRTGGGANAKLQLNHKLEVEFGGGVYDLDNIEIASPVAHEVLGDYR